MVAAFRRGERGIEWLQPLEDKGLQLLTEAKVTANMPTAERQRQVTWALDMLNEAWYESIVQERVHVLEESHARLRKVIKARPLRVIPHTPPDILGCYVLVPAGGSD